MGLAEGGLEFVKLQEDNARAAQEFFANGVRLLKLQQKNAEFVQGWTGDAVEVMREQTEQNVAHRRGLRAGHKQAAGELPDAHPGLGRGLHGLLQSLRLPRQGMRAFQRATQQGLEATEQVARQGLQATEQATKQGLRVAEEATEQTEKVLLRTEKATREAELKAAVLGALETTNYEELDRRGHREQDRGPYHRAAREGPRVREENKDRETLIEQIDRKIRTKNS